MSDSEESMAPEPPVIDPYEVLGLERTATADQVKKAYRKASLRSHPDKVPADEKDEATSAFQSIAFAYAILSDPARRKRYDATGSTSESIVDSEGFNWSDFYREQFQEAISEDAINKFAATYKGSDEEKDDILVAYDKYKGDMDCIYETVMLSDILADDERFRRIIDEAIESGDVKAHKAYTKESAKSKQVRLRDAQAEAREAEDYATELGVHDKLFGNKKGAAKGKGRQAKGKENPEDALAALISSRQKDRGEDFFDHLAEKYGAKKPAKGKKKKAVEEEPDEAAFQAAAARLTKKKASEDPAPKAAKKSRR
ncbi:DnaJ domain-containing protein [Diaporthe helianthi]|uniref:DnaJ domain-containing protein n=1 Tax=Diaporthe helianthi TaxID=158607 RepID=A0A2P5HGK0_DIAHE|nr:DnaJ domain-containing protein [Diaporthe helianthi]